MAHFLLSWLLSSWLLYVVVALINAQSIYHKLLTAIILGLILSFLGFSLLTALTIVLTTELVTLLLLAQASLVFIFSSFFKDYLWRDAKKLIYKIKNTIAWILLPQSFKKVPLK